MKVCKDLVSILEEFLVDRLSSDNSFTKEFLRKHKDKIIVSPTGEWKIKIEVEFKDGLVLSLQISPKGFYINCGGNAFYIKSEKALKNIEKN